MSRVPPRLPPRRTAQPAVPPPDRPTVPPARSPFHPGSTADSPLERRRLRAMLLPVLIGLAVAVYLTWAVLSQQDVAGCGEDGGDCGRLFAGRWSKWFGIPVSLPAALVYAAMLVGIVLLLSRRLEGPIRRFFGSAVLAASAVAAGSAVWFIALMIVLQSICYYCLTVHACSLALFVLALGAVGLPVNFRFRILGGAVVPLAILIAGQALGPVPESYRREVVTAGTGAKPIRIGRSETDKPTSSPPRENSPNGASTNVPAEDFVPQPVEPTPVETSEEPLEPASDSKRTITILDGQVELVPAEQPLLGSPDAEWIVVELFDYTCLHCRPQSRQLAEAMEHFKPRMAVVSLVVPLNAGCNGVMTHTPDQHKNACVLARLSLTVWMADRSRFAEYHEWLMKDVNPPSPEEAEAEAARLIGKQVLDEHRNDWRIDAQLRDNVRVYEKARTGRIPKLILENVILRGEFETAEEMIEQLGKEFGTGDKEP